MFDKTIHYCWVQGLAPRDRRHIENQYGAQTEWQLRFWDETSVLQLMRDIMDDDTLTHATHRHVAVLRDMWHKVPKKSQQCDIARALILLHHGGGYMDCDLVLNLQQRIYNLDALFGGNGDMMLIKHLYDSSHYSPLVNFASHGHYAPTHWLNSDIWFATRRHPVVLEVIERIANNWQNRDQHLAWRMSTMALVWNCSGPGVITNVVAKRMRTVWSNQCSDVVILRHSEFFRNIGRPGHSAYDDWRGGIAKESKTNKKKKDMVVDAIVRNATLEHLVGVIVIVALLAALLSARRRCRRLTLQ